MANCLHPWCGVGGKKCIDCATQPTNDGPTLDDCKAKFDHAEFRRFPKVPDGR